MGKLQPMQEMRMRHECPCTYAKILQAPKEVEIMGINTRHTQFKGVLIMTAHSLLKNSHAFHENCNSLMHIMTP